MKGQPLTYNKDNQEDKEPLFDTVDTLARHAAHHGRDGGRHRRQAPRRWQRAALRGYATATDLADYLVKKGLPFRDAHEVVAHAVKHALQRRRGPGGAAAGHAAGLPRRPSTTTCCEVLTLRGSLKARNVVGGTAPAQVRLQIARHLERLK